MIRIRILSYFVWSGALLLERGAAIASMASGSLIRIVRYRIDNR